MIYDPTVIDLLAHQVLNCVCAALDATAEIVEGQPGCPCRACVVAGQPLLTICDDGCREPLRQGQLYVSINRIYPSTNFPVPDQTPDCRARTLAVEFQVTLVRCAATMDDKGNPPDCDRYATVASIVHTDMLTVLKAINCCVPVDPRRRKQRRTVILEQRPRGPEGTVVGSDTRFVVDLNDACGCPEEVIS